MDESWEYYTKWNKSDRNGQKLSDFTYIWNAKQKSNNELTMQNKDKLIDPGNRIVVSREDRRGGESKMGNGGQLYGNQTFHGEYAIDYTDHKL